MTTTTKSAARKQPLPDYMPSLRASDDLIGRHHAEQQQVKRSRDKDDPAVENKGASINDFQLEQQETYLSDARSRLQCTCRSVFDLKRRTLVCKNTSSAELLAKEIGQQPAGGQLESRLGAKARAISRSGSISGNSHQPTRMGANKLSKRGANE